MPRLWILVEKFVAVKINTELDAGDAYHKLIDPQGKGWAGIPAVGVFRADGTPVEFAVSSYAGDTYQYEAIITGGTQSEVPPAGATARASG